MIDFTAYKHPCLAVPCPHCQSGVGRWGFRPSGHQAAEIHVERGKIADKIFIQQHGEAASIEKTPNGWVINPVGRDKPEPQLTLF